jgi:YidC/Oxa1 family membrane protein insertase
VLFVGTQLLAGLAMAVRGQGLEGPQKFIVFGLPLVFAPFVGTFLAGLSVYWISTNVWTFGQQQVVTSLMPPPPKKTAEELEAEKAPPPPPPRKKKKRSGKRR